MRNLIPLLFCSVCLASAQNVTCAPAVLTETCRQASQLIHLSSAISVVIADPSSFQQEKESMLQLMKRTNKNPVLANMYSEDILIEREGGCPDRIFISTDALRPVKFTKQGNNTVVGPSEGFDPAAAALVGAYVWGFDDGCRVGGLAIWNDMMDTKPKLH